MNHACISAIDSQFIFHDTNNQNDCADYALLVNRVPQFTTQPSSQTICEGQTATFTVALTGSTSGIWQSLATGPGASWTDITGETGTTLSLTDVPYSLNGYQYRYSASNACGISNSNAALLTVNICAISGRKIDSTTGEGLSGWIITAVGNDPFNRDILASNITNETGCWQICCLLKGNYTVCETLKPGWTQTFPNTPDRCYHINVDGKTSFEYLDFHNDPHALCLSGYTFHNITGEGLEGWTIIVTNRTDRMTAVTNDTGYWQVCGLAAGTYTICEEPQDGWIQVAPTPACYNRTLVDANIVGLDFYNQPYKKVFKTADKTTAARGEEITYTIKICNFDGHAWHNVNVTDVFNQAVEITYPVQMVGTTVSWVIDEIAAGECKEFNVVARVPKRESKFEMEQSVSGEGFVNVHNDYSTSLEGSALKNCVYVEINKVTYSDCALVGIGKELGTKIMTKEHGSGTYDTEHSVQYVSKNFSIEDYEDVKAV